MDISPERWAVLLLKSLGPPLAMAMFCARMVIHYMGSIGAALPVFLMGRYSRAFHFGGSVIPK